MGEVGNNMVNVLFSYLGLIYAVNYELLYLTMDHIGLVIFELIG